MMIVFSGADIAHTIKLASTNTVSEIIDKVFEPPYIVKKEHIMEAYKSVRVGKTSVGEVG